MLVQKLGCAVLLLCAVSCLSSCSGTKPPEFKIDKVTVVPVRGAVTVDGEPQAGVKVGVIPQGEFSYKNLSPKALSGTTNEQGEFALTTYDPADGIPPGKYSLIFTWPALALKPMGGNAAEEKSDRFKGRYATRDKSPMKVVTVEEGSPVELEPVNLKTK